MSGRHASARTERARLVVGLGLALGLTLIAFGVVWLRLLEGATALFAVAGLAAIQMAVHLRYFLHLRLRGGERDTNAVAGLAIVLIAIMIGGTILIMATLNYRMGPILN